MHANSALNGRNTAYVRAVYLLEFDNLNFARVFQSCVLFEANVTGFPILIVFFPSRTVRLLVSEHVSCLEGGGSRVGLMKGLTDSSKTQAPPKYLLCHLQNIVDVSLLGPSKAAMSPGTSSQDSVQSRRERGMG